MKPILILILTILTSCTQYPPISIQGRWYQDIDLTTDRHIMDFGEDWLLIGIDHTTWIEETERHAITYWNDMVNIEGVFSEYKIYSDTLYIFDNEWLTDL